MGNHAPKPLVDMGPWAITTPYQASRRLLPARKSTPRTAGLERLEAVLEQRKNPESWLSVLTSDVFEHYIWKMYLKCPLTSWVVPVRDAPPVPIPFNGWARPFRLDYLGTCDSYRYFVRVLEGDKRYDNIVIILLTRSGRREEFWLPRQDVKDLVGVGTDVYIEKVFMFDGENRRDNTMFAVVLKASFFRSGDPAGMERYQWIMVHNIVGHFVKKVRVMSATTAEFGSSRIIYSKAFETGFPVNYITPHFHSHTEGVTSQLICGQTFARVRVLVHIPTSGEFPQVTHCPNEQGMIVIPGRPHKNIDIWPCVSDDGSRLVRIDADGDGVYLEVLETKEKGRMLWRVKLEGAAPNARAAFIDNNCFCAVWIDYDTGIVGSKVIYR